MDKSTKRKKRTFHIFHSLLGTIALLAVEFFLLYLHFPVYITELLILVVAAIGSILNIYVAMEAVEEVRGSMHMFVMLFIVITQFILFFTFEYGFICHLMPGNFPTLSTDPYDLLVNSVLIFVFNPVNLPATDIGRGLLLINTFGALGLVLFVLQNIGQFRRKSLDATIT